MERYFIFFAFFITMNLLRSVYLTFIAQYYNTVKPLNSRHLRVLQNTSVIERCPLVGGKLKKIVTSGTKCFVPNQKKLLSKRLKVL